MKSTEEIGKIFIEEAKRAIDEDFDNVCKVANDIMNKTEEVEKEYAFLCNTLANRLPERGITEEELKSFIPYIKDYQNEIANHILQKLIGKENEDVDTE
jgi:hypothetical protein